MAQHHPDRCDQPRPAPLTPYPRINTHTHTHLHLFSPILPYRPPSSPSFLFSLPRSSSPLPHHQCFFIWLTSYLSCRLSALAFWCWEKRDVCTGRGGLVVFATDLPLAPGKRGCLMQSPCGIMHASTSIYIDSVQHLCLHRLLSRTLLLIRLSFLLTFPLLHSNPPLHQPQ